MRKKKRDGGPSYPNLRTTYHEYPEKTQEVRNRHYKPKNELKNNDNHRKREKEKMEKSKTHNRLQRKGKRKGKEKHTSEKNAAQMEAENHRSKIKVVARVGGGEEA